MDRRLLDILACPVTHQPLLELDARALAALNARIGAGQITRGDGASQREPLAAALVTRDGRRVYRVDDGIPVLLAEDALLLPADAA